MNRPSIWILGGIFLIVLAICVAGAILAIAADDPNVDVNLGDDEFQLEDVEGAAERIAGAGPDIFPDPTGGDRPIMVNHVGDDPDEGWVVVLALKPGTTACTLSWDADEDAFRDCEGTTYPADGEGLDRFPSRVEDDTLFVDLGRGRQNDEDETPTTTTLLVTGAG